METEEKIYTIEDIANELGVSKTTVSRAISGKGRISRHTRERVLDFIELHDYRPNVIARGLAQSKTYNLAMIMPMDYTGSDAPFFKECTNGICEIASANNYDILISVMDGQDLSQIQRIVTNRKVDGIIISRSVARSEAQRYLLEKKIPFVVIGRSDLSGVQWVDNDNQESSKELTELMLMKGIKKLALLGGDQRHLVTKCRLKGFLEAHEAQGTAADKSLLFFDVDNYLKVQKSVEESLEAGADGIICMDDSIANMVLSCLREKGIHIPSQIKLASFYDSPQLEINTPTVTSLHFNTRELGKNACLSLLKQLGEDIQQEEYPLNYQVILRESTK
ncbi:MAG: LacI family DNA-binding transcriptional regulator [Eubacteriales bacterium]|nr:LacI family DNA-binding transcriptional regulator [Eubacteriales bacterium]